MTSLPPLVLRIYFDATTGRVTPLGDSWHPTEDLPHTGWRYVQSCRCGSIASVLSAIDETGSTVYFGSAIPGVTQ